MNEPEYLKRWKLPRDYFGAEWPEHYVFLGQNRDSGALTRANFDAALKAIGGEQVVEDTTDETGQAEILLVTVVRESHWAVGWVEWIAIHESAAHVLKIADEIMRNMESYPVVDEKLFSQYEHEEAYEVWRNCYSIPGRIAYIRANRSQFEFRDFADMRGCIRGEYFAGYASELIG